MAEKRQRGEKVLHGIPVSTGVCRGKVLVVKKIGRTVSQRELSESEVAENLDRLHKALVTIRQQIQEGQKQVAKSLGDEQASIFEAHLLILEDPALLEEVARMVECQKVNVEFAFHASAERYSSALA